MVVAQVVVGKKIKWKKILFVLSVFFSFFISINVYAETNIPTRPNNGIYDPKNYLSQDVVDKIVQHNTSSQTQISLYIVDTLDGKSIEEQANKIAKEWKIGYKDVDKGLLILIAIKDRKFRIETSDEVAVYLTDGESKTILNSTKDYMREEDYSDGVLHIINEIEKELTTDLSNNQTQMFVWWKTLPDFYKNVISIIIVIGFSIIVIVRSILNVCNSDEYSSCKKKFDYDTITSDSSTNPYYNLPSSYHSLNYKTNYISSKSTYNHNYWDSNHWSGGGFSGGGASGDW